MHQTRRPHESNKSHKTQICTFVVSFSKPKQRGQKWIRHVCVSLCVFFFCRSVYLVFDVLIQSHIYTKTHDEKEKFLYGCLSMATWLLLASSAYRTTCILKENHSNTQTHKHKQQTQEKTREEKKKFKQIINYTHTIHRIINDIKFITVNYIYLYLLKSWTTQQNSMRQKYIRTQILR